MFSNAAPGRPNLREDAFCSITSNTFNISKWEAKMKTKQNNYTNEIYWLGDVEYLRPIVLFSVFFGPVIFL